MNVIFVGNKKRYVAIDPNKHMVCLQYIMYNGSKDG